MPTLKEEFHQAMINIYNRAKDECNYMAAHLIQMINEAGGLKAAKELLHNNFTVGFETLSEMNRLDISVEWLILDPKWVELFTEEEILIAKERLLNHGFDLSQLFEPSN